MATSPSETAGQAGFDQLLALRGRAYVLAVRVLGRGEDAEDAVQKAYLDTIRRLQRGFAPDDWEAWFLAVVLTAAREQLRSEIRRRRREASVQTADRVRLQPGIDQELVSTLGDCLAALDEKYRLPLSLCYEQGLSHQQAAAVLGIHQTTLSRHVSEGLELLRKALGRAGYAAAPVAVIGGLAHTAPPVPATLWAALEKLVSSGTMAKGSSAAVATTAAKGGLAVKIIAGVVAAGMLAGAVAVVNGVGAGFKPAPTALPSPPVAAPAAEFKPAPVNDYKGMQEREEVFEFAEKPAVKKEGDKWIITFASKGKCDATVAILDKDGKIVRHLASGVLGVNAPYPFQQNSLSQKVEWDGEDDTGKKAPAGCSVRVSLGLKPVFERNIAYCPYDLPAFKMPYGKRTDKFLTGDGPNGEIIILAVAGSGAWQGRVYGKDGRYLRTFWPPAAKDAEKMKDLGYRFATTKWGDKTLVGYWFGPFVEGGAPGAKSDPAKAISVLAGVAEAKEMPRPAALPASSLPNIALAHAGDLANFLYNGKQIRMAADPYREEIHIMGLRFDGKTGKADESWFPKGGLNFAEGNIGPDGLLYMRIGGACYGQWIVRVDPATAKAVPFTGNEAAPLPAKEWPDAPGKGFYCGGGWEWIGGLKGQNVNSIWVGTRSHSVTHAGGFFVSPRGMLAAPIRLPDCGWGKKHGLPADWSSKPSQLGAEWPVFELATVGVWDKEGNFLTANAVGGNIGPTASHGMAMDRDGSLYVTLGGCVPAGQKCLDGITDVPVRNRTWGAYGTVVKFRGQGGKYPLGRTYSKATKDQAPAGAMKLDGAVNGVEGALWAYGGMVGQSTGDCTCCNDRSDMDYYARYWIVSNQLYSVTVLDANGNRVARLGRYGNVDDTDEDVKAGRDGLRFAWMRALGVTDKALYVCDTGSRRILKAAVKYAAEETAPAP